MPEDQSELLGITEQEVSSSVILDTVESDLECLQPNHEVEESSDITVIESEAVTSIEDKGHLKVGVEESSWDTTVSESLRSVF